MSTQDPLQQLSLILSPFGIKTVTTGSGEVGAYLQARYGTHDPDAVNRAFIDNLTKVPFAKAVVLGVPSDNGAGFDRGSKKGPLCLRKQWLEKKLYPMFEEFGVIDIGDVRDHPLLIDDNMYRPKVIKDVRNARWGHLGNVSQRLQLPVSVHSILDRALECLYALNPKIKVLLLGGDHSNSRIPINVLTRNSRNKNQTLGILQFDAHTDLLQTRDGVEASFATWSWHANEAIGKGGRLVQVGIRTSGHDKAYWEKQLGVHQYWANEIVHQPWNHVIDTLIEDFAKAGVERIYISNDIDGVSSGYAAATGTPEPNGLSPNFVSHTIRRISDAFDVVGSDIMEVAPTLVRNIPDEPNRTASIAAHFAIEQLRAMLKDDTFRSPFEHQISQLEPILQV